MKLHKEIDKVLAINCINNQVSVKAVRKLWGERGVRRGLNSFQQWYKSGEVSAIFKETSGVANGQGSALALSIWNGKSQEEKDSYKVQNQPVISATTSNSINSAPDAEDGTARTEVVSNVEANNMAATYKGDFVIIGVSNYLGNDSYQVVRATPRALKWVEHNRICNPKNHVAAQLHAFVTGTQAGLLNISQTKLDDRARCRESLSEMIRTKTQGVIKKWTWKGCKEKLLEDGYYVQLALDSKSDISYIMQDSNQLTQTQAHDVLDDILQNKILILETEAGPTRKRKRAHGSESEPPSTTWEEPPTTPTPGSNSATNVSTTPIINHSANDNVPVPANDTPITKDTSISTAVDTM
ncbi:uncharacterized protein MELLADRAFT_86087 [Melampsora larici-populina 98AG31]|uniref:Uncharacterized protein n=1 Tax=Melampsora larici-populina (strain 98AG31 / pathotype 3-4-7) TaxID=747676 RepID=F4RKQ7_MELLP|nr:uncharacterized protein MELLADRAFT_86087 [Melampsora larici-populina 98AG31]EGG07134.1 hypothetical protein MELLADRAFT_86087 [Melampsora larici-populina 98AG31]